MKPILEQRWGVRHGEGIYYEIHRGDEYICGSINKQVLLHIVDLHNASLEVCEWTYAPGDCFTFDDKWHSSCGGSRVVGLTGASGLRQCPDCNKPIKVVSDSPALPAHQ